MDYKNAQLENLHIFFKIASLQCLPIQRLYSESFHEWKIIPLYFIESIFGKRFKFHSNLDFKHSILNYFPSYYHKDFANWKPLFSAFHIFISSNLNQFLWCNRHIKIHKVVVFYETFSEKGINFLMQHFMKMELQKYGVY